MVGTSSALTISQNASNIDYSNLTVAVVRAPPANLPYPPPSTDWNGRTYDLDQTVELGVGYIKEAALRGANFVAFPELWFPGYAFFSPCAWPPALTKYVPVIILGLKMVPANSSTIISTKAL